jgi:GDP-4-dehydro-6-deoxy-D-mannose reductase
LIEIAGVVVQVEPDPKRLRPSDVPVAYSDNRRLVAATGWQPEYSLRTTLTDLLQGWRQQLAGTKPPPALAG